MNNITYITKEEHLAQVKRTRTLERVSGIAYRLVDLFLYAAYVFGFFCAGVGLYHLTHI